ncbi:LytTR family DNA-binding domain-containing protein [Lacibacter sp. MH-610]|uniref:LytR/AlgR family response regulator transcription factor n=1 Tax=Lacibacter sp. MH-610 TaxID=3020883 RepID=UPI003891FB0C
MQLLKCIIIDDDPLSCSVLQELARQRNELRLITSLNSVEEASAFLAMHNDLDLIFLDVDINGSSGISLFRKLKQRPNVIFTTSHEEFAFVAFELGAIDYLKKPFTKERFNRSIDRLLKHVAEKPTTATPYKEDERMFFKVGRVFKSVVISDILFLKGSRDYIRIVTTDQSIMVLMTMQEMMTKLDPEKFVRTGKSYIVNKNQIKDFSGNELSVGKNKIPVSRIYLQLVKNSLGLR